MPENTPGIYPCLFYRDGAAAVEWLEQAFGFRKLLVVPGADGTLVHAELAFGSGVIMLGTAQEERGWMSPRSLPGINQIVCLHVEDVDAHYERAKAAGAEIERQPKDTDYGSRDFCCRDPEGHLWNFSTYGPEAVPV